MQCDYFDAGRCRSCTLMGVPYTRQVARKQAQAEQQLPAVPWAPPFTSAESGFRNKAKLVVGGRTGRPTLGILDEDGRGVDLQGCGLYEPALADLLPVLHDLVAGARIPPYDVPRRRGELKNILVTVSPAGEAMVRFVLRSPAEIDVLRHNLPRLEQVAPQVRVVTANLLPEHKAVLEGEEEIVLTEQAHLPMAVNGFDLLLGPRSFFQTNTAVAAGLYRQAAEWFTGPSSVLDLYSGVGGFALHLAGDDRSVVGVETSPDAVDAARRTAQTSVRQARFVADDAEAYVAALARDETPGGIVVNPPRRGLGSTLTDWLESSDVAEVLYSSCNPASLARDLAAMPSFAPSRARLFDMFPQSLHAEVLVHLTRL